MSQFAEPVFPDESALAGEIRNPATVQYNQVRSGSRLTSRFAGLGRDDEVRTGEFSRLGIDRSNKLKYFTELIRTSYLNP